MESHRKLKKDVFVTNENQSAGLENTDSKPDRLISFRVIGFCAVLLTSGYFIGPRLMARYFMIQEADRIKRQIDAAMQVEYHDSLSASEEPGLLSEDSQ